LAPTGLVVARFVSLVLLYFTAMHMVGAPFPRYSIPLRPFLYGMGLLTAAWGWQFLCRRWVKSKVLPVSMIETTEAMK
jgi:hypothetical protein